MSSQDSLPMQALEDLYNAEFTKFFSDHRLSLYKFLMSKCDDRYLCDDVVQDSMLSIRERWDRARDFENTRAYLFKVAINRLNRLLRERGKHGMPIEPVPDRPTPTLISTEATNRVLIETAIRKLPRRQMEVATLRLLCDFSEAETADILSIKQGTVKESLHQARKRLKEIIKTT